MGYMLIHRAPFLLKPCPPLLDLLDSPEEIPFPEQTCNAYFGILRESVRTRSRRWAIKVAERPKPSLGSGRFTRSPYV